MIGRKCILPRLVVCIQFSFFQKQLTHGSFVVPHECGFEGTDEGGSFEYLKDGVWGCSRCHSKYTYILKVVKINKDKL